MNDIPTQEELEDTGARIEELTKVLANAAPTVLQKMHGGNAEMVNPAEASSACIMAGIVLTLQFCPDEEMPGAIATLLRSFIELFEDRHLDEAFKILDGLTQEEKSPLLQ